MKAKVKFKVKDGEVIVDCPESGEISAQAWCPFCKRKNECWGNSLLDEIISHFEKKEIHVKDTDEKVKRYVNEILGLKLIRTKRINLNETEL